jgi:hypothetical protein
MGMVVMEAHMGSLSYHIGGLDGRVGLDKVSEIEVTSRKVWAPNAWTKRA